LGNATAGGAGSAVPSDGLTANLAFLSGGGEMGARMRALDWGKTPLGSPERWPQSLKTTLERIESFQPDVALLDIGLPEINGYELAQRLRVLPQLEGLRLVALTGYGQPEDHERTRAAGFDDHLVKPVDTSTLERTLAGIYKSGKQESWQGKPR
jgi:CheY-like chemotaxis protein